MLRSAFRASVRPFRVARGLSGLLLALSVSATPAVAEWAAKSEDMGRHSERTVVYGGAFYGVLGGSEVDATDPSIGFEGGIATRFFGPFSLIGSAAFNTVDVDGQMAQLLDMNMRENGMSAHVTAQIDILRFRFGVRLQGLSREGWRFHPYFEAGASYTQFDVAIDTINRVAPVPFSQDPDSEPTDISTFDDSQLGAMSRFGIEADLSDKMGIDLGVSLEVLELPAGTNTMTSAGARLFYRI